MQKIVVKSGESISGQVQISGAKNAALALIAASLLGAGKTTFENVPKIVDIEMMLNILECLGIEVDQQINGMLTINPDSLKSLVAPYDLVKKMRASNLLIGPLLARYGRAEIALPGGCDIGSRPMDLHLKGFQAMGAEVVVEHGCVKARSRGRLRGEVVYLDFPSVGATENIMMAGTLAQGTTVIENAAKEPEIVDLANYLNSMGAKIRGAGTDVIKIDGVEELTGTHYSIIPDRIEAGTFMVAAAITAGDILIKNVIPKHLDPVSAKLREIGAEIIEEENGLRVIGRDERKATDIKTMPYPGFPTDMQPQMMALLSVSEGTSVVTENIFENRFRHVAELKRLGAKIKIEGRTAVIEGVKKLSGASVQATDLRAGAALILAGLAAEGTTEIGCVSHIIRGYENIVEKFQGLGVDIFWK
ncbi:MAG TPA: UDP-N-acetylglucosamine 1-carboxyvinyltransferase [Clostridia bacterium]|nr:UDP-N-acetylglucosamine 1-carboxyvinyltransferase [Clostridia bacterium]